MSDRRSFLSYAVGMLASIAGAQKTVMEKGQAVVCDGTTLKCPNGHMTCPTINATMAIGNDNRNYPETAVLFDYHIVRCDVCHVLFTKE